METLKPLPEIHLPDERNLMFVRMDTGKPITLEEHHAHVASIKLNSAIPEDVRSYFATIQNVCLYSWFAYDLYAIVQFLCLTCSEMALRMRLPASGRDRRSLTELVKAAAKKKLIKAKGFSHIRQMRQAAAERVRMERHMLKQAGPWPSLPKSTAPKTDYAGEVNTVVAQCFRAPSVSRNHRARTGNLPASADGRIHKPAVCAIIYAQAASLCWRTNGESVSIRVWTRAASACS